MGHPICEDARYVTVPSDQMTRFCPTCKAQQPVWQLVTEETSQLLTGCETCGHTIASVPLLPHVDTVYGLRGRLEDLAQQLDNRTKLYQAMGCQSIADDFARLRMYELNPMLEILDGGGNDDATPATPDTTNG